MPPAADARANMKLSRGLSFCETPTARHWLAYREQAGIRQHVVIRRADGGDCRALLERAAGGANCPTAWSPDGKFLYYSGDQLYRINVRTGAAVPITAFPADETSAVHWLLQCSPDGQRLLFLRGANPEVALRENTRQSVGVWEIRTDGSELRQVVGSSPAAFLWLADVLWQRDLLAVAFIVADRRTEIWTMDLAGENRRRVAGLSGCIWELALSPTGDELVYCDELGTHLLQTSDCRSRRLARHGNCSAWSPDGGALAFLRDDFELWLARPADGRARRLVWAKGRPIPAQTRGGSFAQTPVWSPDGRLLWFSLAKTGREAPAQLSEQHCLEEDTGYTGMRRWKLTRWIGILDLVEGTVWMKQGAWDGVAWSPAGARTLSDDSSVQIRTDA